MSSGNKDFIGRVLKFEMFYRQFNKSIADISFDYQFKIPKEKYYIMDALDEFFAGTRDIKTFYIIKHDLPGFEFKFKDEYYFFSVGYTDINGNTDTKGIYLIECI